MHIAITGASSGIGEALAREFGIGGNRVTLVARREDLLRLIAKTLPAESQVVVRDLSRPESALDWVDEAEEALGPIEVLVNNAGMDLVAGAVEVDEAAARDLVNLNLLIPQLLSREIAGRMASRGGGTVVNITSLAAVLPMRLRAWYGGSKAGLAAFSESLRLELAAKRVNVLTVYPGPVKTAMGMEAVEALGGSGGISGFVPMGDPAALARVVRKAVARRKARVIYPAWCLLPWFFPRIATGLASVFGPKERRTGSP